MADLKISQLTDGGASQAADEYVVARSGSNFRIDGASVAAAATSVGTLTSLTVSGTTSLSNRIGFSASANLTAAGQIGRQAGTGLTLWPVGGTTYDFVMYNAAGTANVMAVPTGTTNAVFDGNLIVDTNTLYVDAANNRVGVGTASPSVGLDVSGASGTTAATIRAINTGTAVGDYAIYQLKQGTGSTWQMFVGANNDTLTFGRGGVGDYLYLNNSGNLGLGVTPSAWASTWKALEFSSATLASRTDARALWLNNNAYFDGTNFKYKNTAIAQAYVQGTSGEHAWFNAPSGTAGNTISFTQAMTLDASGNLGVGTASPNLSGGSSGGVALTLSAFQSGRNALLELNGTRTSSGFSSYIRFFNNAAATPFADIQGLRGSSDTTGDLAFATSGTERARITAVGTLNVGTNPDSGAVGAYLAGYNGFAAQISNNLFYNFSGTNATGTRTFYVEGDGDVYNTNGTYGTISDIKHKQDVIDAPSQWDDLKAIRFRKFRMKSDVEANPDAPYLLGVVAQELEQTSPGLIEQHPDFEEQEVTDEDGNVTTERVQVGTTKTVKSSILLMKAAVALQEAMARIEALEVEVAALKGGA